MTEGSDASVGARAYSRRKLNGRYIYTPGGVGDATRQAAEEVAMLDRLHREAIEQNVTLAEPPRLQWVLEVSGIGYETMEVETDSQGDQWVAGVARAHANDWAAIVVEPVTGEAS